MNKKNKFFLVLTIFFLLIIRIACFADTLYLYEEVAGTVDDVYVPPNSEEKLILHFSLNKTNTQPPWPSIPVTIKFDGNNIAGIANNSAKMYVTTKDTFTCDDMQIEGNFQNGYCVFVPSIPIVENDRHHFFITYRTNNDVCPNDIINMKVDVSSSLPSGWVSIPDIDFLDSPGHHIVKDIMPTSLEIISPDTVIAGAPFDVTVKALDRYGEIYEGYDKHVKIMSSDNKAVVPDPFVIPEGVRTFPNGVTLFNAASLHTLWVTEVEGSAITPQAPESFITVLPRDEIESFDIIIAGISGDSMEVVPGEPFRISVESKDRYENVSGSDEHIYLSVEQGSFAVLPDPYMPAPSLYQRSYDLQLGNGRWSGMVALNADSTTNRFVVTGGGITSRQESILYLAVPNAEKDMNYPNPFSSIRETTTIRYYMPSPSNADIRIYTMTGILVRAWNIDGQQDINLLEWDGKDGSGNSVASGGYLCAIWKKGFESVLSGGLDNKPIIIKIAVVN